MKIKYSLLCVAIVWLCVGCGTTSYLEQEDTSQVVTAEESTETGDAEDTQGEEDSAGEQVIYVQVSGAVACPGVYALSSEARVYEALQLAGGMTEEACDLYLNQAVKLSDGERIYVPTAAEVVAGEAYPGSETAAEAQSSGSSTDGRVNINTATLEELMTLSGIGETKAKAIISYREKNGSFQNPADIKNVSGIGDSTYSNIAEYITVQ